jgi:hypothetical protein
MSAPLRAELPKVLRSARILIFVQAGIGIVAGLALIAVITSSDVADGGGLVLLLALSTLLAVVLFTCGILISRRLEWVRVTAIAVECVNVAAVVIGTVAVLLSDSPPVPAVVVQLVLSALVIKPLASPEARVWFSGPIETREG